MRNTHANKSAHHAADSADTNNSAAG